MALSSEGFASGFTKGFGLVTDVKDNFARQKLAEEELRQRDQDRTDRGLERTADLNYRTNNDALRAKQRKEDLDRASVQRTEDQTLQATQRTEDLQFQTDQLDRTKNDVLNGTLTRQENQDARAKKESENKQVLFDRTTKDLDRQDKERQNEEQIVLAGQSANDLLTFDFPAGGLDETDAGAFNTAVNNTNGSTLSIAGALNPFTPEVAQNVANDIQVFSSGQDMTNKVNILGGANIMIQKNLKGIGEIIPSTVEGEASPYPNAPPEFRTGKWKIISKEAYDIVPNPDGSIGVSVLVRVKDDEGHISKYLAPATEQREPNGLSVTIGAEEFTGGFAGMVHYSKEMSKNKENIYQGMIEAQYRKDGKHDRSSYKAAFDRAEALFDERLEYRGEQKVMQGSNRTFNDIASKPLEKAEYVRHQLLTDDSIPVSYRDETAGEIAVARSVREIQSLEKHRRKKMESTGEAYKPLTDQQILEARTYLDENDSGNIFVSNQGGYGRWQRKIYGSVIPQTRGYSGTGSIPIINRFAKP